ncbi:hypothetical protein ACFO0N_02845 [Halobium salinum]|uniref:Uncharacterized protein n=1 Tax=Halobium salinum TaxID=1364940 RepID=A0ABD5P7Q0_9EURY|nr:hypothetical protein [Halobium salinum]
MADIGDEPPDCIAPVVYEEVAPETLSTTPGAEAPAILVSSAGAFTAVCTEEPCPFAYAPGVRPRHDGSVPVVSDTNGSYSTTTAS